MNKQYPYNKQESKLVVVKPPKFSNYYQKTIDLNYNNRDNTIVK